MDFRATSFSTTRPQAKSIIADYRNRLSLLNKPSKSKSKSLLLSTTPTNKTNKKNLNNILLLTKKTIINRPIALADKKGILLYQQQERNNLLSSGHELVNRFHFKV